MLATSAWTDTLTHQNSSCVFNETTLTKLPQNCNVVLTKDVSRTPQPTTPPPTPIGCFPGLPKPGLSKPRIELHGKPWEYPKAVIQLSHFLFNACNKCMDTPDSHQKFKQRVLRNQSHKVAPKLQILSSQGCLPHTPANPPTPIACPSGFAETACPNLELEYRVKPGNIRRKQLFNYVTCSSMLAATSHSSKFKLHD